VVFLDAVSRARFAVSLIRQEEVLYSFIELVWLLNICMHFEISDAEIEQIRTGFIAWVEKYEE
jgi:hypothetical protein